MPTDEPPLFEPRELNCRKSGGLRVLDCVAAPAPENRMELRAFFAHGTDAGRFERNPPDDCARIATAHGINGALMLSGTAPAGERVRIALVDGPLDLPVTTPELHLFEGLHTALAEWHGEPLDQLEDWLRYHAETFGLQAALLIERARQPAEADAQLAEIAARAGLSRLVLLRSAMPLGNPDLPPVIHASHAPDAPSPDKLAPMAPDAQTAPLQNLVLYETLRWRFLNSARTVMNLDLSDLLRPGAEPFAQAERSTSGVVQLMGQRIYPWRVRKGRAPRFGDHICRQFENQRANRRWCLAPGRLSPDQIWRFVRVTGTFIGARDVAPFWRAMALRHPQASVAEIVAKSTLIEDPELITLARDRFAHKPVRAPQAKPVAAPSSGRSCIVTCMKNEGPFILEWIAYHRAIGFDDFLIYSNDCTDGTDRLLDLLDARGIVQHRANPFKPGRQKPQHAALKAAGTEPVVQNCEWAICMDVDEFINIHVGDGRLADLFGAVGQANMISLTWRLFGNADIAEFQDGFITDQFTRCAPELIRAPHQAWGFKTLFRNMGIYKKLGVHRPKALRPEMWDQINWVNGSGKPMPRKTLRNGWRSTLDSYGYGLATLNHYATRSAESFLVKRDRGRVNHVDRDQGLAYWFRMNNNAQEDRSIASKAALLQAEHAQLMGDAQIAEAHQACVTAHRAKIFELKGDNRMGPFFKQITSARMQKLSRLHRHFANSVFLAGPEAIPDDIIQRDELPEDFLLTVPPTQTKG